MKIASWNVNGIISRRKALIKFLNKVKPDILCAQEIKTQCALNLPGYELYWNVSERKGYAGTLILTRRKPAAYQNGIGIEKFDAEARSITMEFKDYILVITPELEHRKSGYVERKRRPYQGNVVRIA